MRKQESGFTLIELVIVLVILGILAAVAIPRFEDLSTDAKNAAKSGGVSSVASALAIEMAKTKGLVSAGSVVTRLPGSASTAVGVGFAIKIPGQGTQVVEVTLLNDGGGLTLAASTTASVAAVGTGVFSG